MCLTFYAYRTNSCLNVYALNLSLYVVCLQKTIRIAYLVVSSALFDINLAIRLVSLLSSGDGLSLLKASESSFKSDMEKGIILKMLSSWGASLAFNGLVRSCSRRSSTLPK